MGVLPPLGFVLMQASPTATLNGIELSAASRTTDVWRLFLDWTILFLVAINDEYGNSGGNCQPREDPCEKENHGFAPQL